MIRMLLTSYVYDNFELYNPTITLEMIVWSLCAGLILGACCSFFSRRVVGSFVRRLLSDGIDAPEKGITLAEAGFEKNPFVRWALKTGKPLRKLVLCANEEEFVHRKPSDLTAARGARKLFSVEAEETVVTDFARARFYIPEDLRYAAEIKYDAKGTTVPMLILSALLLVGVSFAALYLVPELLTMLDNFLTQIRS